MFRTLKGYIDSLGWYNCGEPVGCVSRCRVTVLDLVAAVGGYIWPTLTSLTQAVKKAWMGNRGADLQLVPCADQLSNAKLLFNLMPWRQPSRLNHREWMIMTTLIG
jgi:hypothetical protein